MGSILFYQDNPVKFLLLMLAIIAVVLYREVKKDERDNARR